MATAKKKPMEERRRANFLRWLRFNGVPKGITRTEMSMLSQLKKEGNPFGEKIARRLEETYGMGDHFLDQPEDNTELSKPSKIQIISTYLAALPEEKLDALALILGIKLK